MNQANAIANLVGCNASSFRHEMGKILGKDFKVRTVREIRKAAKKSHALNGDKDGLLQEINDIEYATRTLSKEEVPGYLRTACRRSKRTTRVDEFRAKQRTARQKAPRS